MTGNIVRYFRFKVQRKGKHEWYDSGINVDTTSKRAALVELKKARPDLFDGNQLHAKLRVVKKG